ncbi:MAG: TIGR01777 family protein [Phycisphaerales bacterium]|nr:TIGR01777 family protein [Phycisphaerales bacterium]
MPAPREMLAAWHFAHGALQRLLPPWQSVDVESAEPLADGSRTVLRLSAGPVRTRWVAVHEQVRPGHGFIDRAERSPFARWRHEHLFLDRTDPAQSQLVDRIRYALPWPARIPPISMLAAPMARAQLARMFAFRHERTARDLRRHMEHRARAGDRPITVAVTGATGLVGSALCAFLETGGHRVIRLVRGGGPSSLPGRPPSAPAAPPGPVTPPAPATAGALRDVPWNPRGEWDASPLSGIDAVVHLAGENIAAGRWTAARKDAILRSREEGTRSLARALASLAQPPRVLVSASGVGYYGHSDAPAIDESGAPGAGFLAEVARRWEQATEPAEASGMRVVRLRIGVVVSARGGVVGTLRTPFNLGAGGPVGSGRQGMSWISLDDLLGAILHVIGTPSLSGPVNAVAPHPVTQRDFARAMGRAMWRPAFSPLPAFAVKLLFGEMGQELLLSGQFAVPAALAASGFRFDSPRIGEAMAFEFGRATAWGTRA